MLTFYMFIQCLHFICFDTMLRFYNILTVKTLDEFIFSHFFTGIVKTDNQVQLQKTTVAKPILKVEFSSGNQNTGGL